MMHVMDACMDVSIITIHYSHIHDSPTARVPMTTFPCHMSVPKHVHTFQAHSLHVPMFPLGQIIRVLQFWDFWDYFKIYSMYLIEESTNIHFLQS